MADGHPLVSVCIPLYNAKTFVGDTVDSVLRQTYQNWELIITDDLSTDGSWDIAVSYRDERIRCFRNQERLGAEGNWNRALSMAKGDYVKLLCHDDLLAPTCLERQVTVFLMDERHGISLVSSARDIINHESKMTLRRQWFRRDTMMDGLLAVRATFRAGTNWIGEPSATLFRTEDARRVGLFDGSRPYVIDLDYWVRLLARGKLYYLAESLCSFRISRQSWSSQLAQSQTRQFTDLMIRIWRKGVYGVTVRDVLSGWLLSRVNGVARRVWFGLRA
jgi:glycosyltransferase involved in cell wall biosynthesis